MGKTALEAHLSSAKHKSAIHAASTSRSMDEHVVKKTSPLATKIAIAEGTLAFHTVTHHLSYKQMDCTAPLLKSLFSDSEIASKLSCSRTKTEAIINGIFSPYSIELIKQEMKDIPFLGLGTDGSNHKNLKMFPITIQYFDKNEGLKVRLLNLNNLPNEKAETVVTHIRESLDENGLTEKFSAFVADNTNTNFGGLNRGGKNNIFYSLKEKMSKPHLVGIGCSSHIVHNAVHHGLDRFGLFDIDCLVFKIFEYFSIYTVRTEELKSFCEFVESDYRELLSHSRTRWLSLFPAVERILKMYQALKSYFLSQKNLQS